MDATGLSTMRLLICGELALPASLGAAERGRSLDDALERIAAAPGLDAFVAALSAADAQRMLVGMAWQAVLRDIAIVLVLPSLDDANAALALRLVTAGVQEVLDRREAAAGLERRIRFATLRKQQERNARKSWSTDLDTGLPNREQLLEHLNQLLALRARQPASMALLAVRIDGLAEIVSTHGAEAAQIVRRKVAVRLRGAVRASDVVASLGGGTFALLLATIEAAADAQRVALKLARLLREPFSVLGSPLGVAAHIGVAVHPADGADAEPLLATALASALAAARRRGGAANDAAA